MGFYIDYQKMRGYYVDAEMWLASNMNALSNLSQRWTELAESEGMKGEGADAIRAYIREYHLSMINGLTVLLLQLYSKLLLYTDDYYTNIDADPDAMLIEDALNSYIDGIRNRMNMVDYFHEEARTALKSVSSMCNMDAPGKVAFEEIGRGLIRRMEQLINDVTVLEENHVGDLDEPEEMLRSLNGMMSLFNWRPGKRMSGYSAGLVTGSTEFVVYAYAIQENMEDYEAQVEQIEIAQEHEEDRKIVEQRILGGVLQVLNGVGAVFAGVCAILSTGGAATPLVVMAWFGAGGATLYGLSEIGEGIQSHALGLQRDTETETFNFERDVLCGGNQELYDTLGKLSVGLCDLTCFAVDMTDLFGVLRRNGFGGRFGVNQLDDYAEYLTKGMDEVDNVLDDMIEAIPSGSADNIVERISESGSKADVLTQNRANGRAFEQQEFAKFSSQNNSAVEQITVKTSSGVRTRVDAIGLDAKGNVVINEYKSSLTAPLTNNQKIAFPEIFESGATVVGKGKGIFSGGYQIPSGTKVTIIRPK